MSIQATLVTYLKAQVSAVSQRVYPLKAPDTPTVPYIVVSRVSNVRLMTHQGYIGESRIRWQVSVFDTDYTRCRTTANSVVTALEAWAGIEVTVGYALHTGETEIYEPDTKRYHIPVDFMVLCEE